MIQQWIDKRTLNHFGLEKLTLYHSKTVRSFQDDIRFAIETNQMLAISGPVGNGKTMLFTNAVKQIENLKLVYVQDYFKENVKIGSLLNALIYDLSDESPRHNFEARSRQTIRVVGKIISTEDIKICLVIEEAHRLHANTLRALKELREASFNNICPLFSVVLLGHPGLQTKLESRKEAYWRSHSLELNESNGWMDYSERISFLRVVFKDALDNDARKSIATVCKAPLEMIFYIKNKMIEARKAGKNVLDGEVVKPTNLELKNAMNLSLSQIADEAKMGRTTVHDILQNADHPKSPEVAKAIAKLKSKTKQRKVA